MYPPVAEARTTVSGLVSEEHFCCIDIELLMKGCIEPEEEN